MKRDLYSGLLCSGYPDTSTATHVGGFFRWTRGIFRVQDEGPVSFPRLPFAACVHCLGPVLQSGKEKV